MCCCLCVSVSVVVVATVCRARDLSIMGSFIHQVEMESPTEEQRLAMLVGLSRELHLGRDVNLERLSKLTAVSVDLYRTYELFGFNKILN